MDFPTVRYGRKTKINTYNNTIVQVEMVNTDDMLLSLKGQYR